VRQVIVHHEARGNPARVVLLRPAEEVDIARLAQAQADQLQVFTHDVGDDIVHQVQALLAAQAADYADEGHLGAQFKAQLLLQRALVDRLAGQILRGVGGSDALVIGRVKLTHIQAIEDAA